MSDELVKRLRAGTGDGLRAFDWMNEAADRIETLKSALDRITAWAIEHQDNDAIPDDLMAAVRAALEGK